MSHCPWASMTRAPAGTRHSPAAPAQTILPARTRVTALGTGARPVPSQRLALTIARVGLGAGATRLWGGRPPQAFKVNVPRKTAERTVKGSFIYRALLALVATRRSSGGRHPP